MLLKQIKKFILKYYYSYFKKFDLSISQFFFTYYLNSHMTVYFIFHFLPCNHISLLTKIFISLESTTQGGCHPTQLLVVAEIHSETTNESSKLYLIPALLIIFSWYKSEFSFKVLLHHCAVKLKLYDTVKVILRS